MHPTAPFLFLGLLALGAGAAAAAPQGQPVTPVSRTVGLTLSEMRSGLSSATNGGPLITVWGPPGSTFVLAMEATSPSLTPIDMFTVVPGLIGPLALPTGPSTVVVPDTWVTDPSNPALTGPALFTIPPGATSRTLDFTFPIPTLPFETRFQAAVTIPATGAVPAGIYLTNAVMRSALLATGPMAYADGPLLTPPGNINWDIEQADVDGDGDLDVLGITQVPPMAAIFLQTGGANGLVAAPFLNGLPNPLLLPPTLTPRSAEFADFDSDGWMDIVIVGTGIDPEFMPLYRNAGAVATGGTPAFLWLGYEPFVLPVLPPEIPPGALVNGNDVETGDFDGDGRIDFFVACGLDPAGGEQNRLVSNISAPLGGGPLVFFDVTPFFLPEILDDSEDCEVFDFDLDGDLDIVVANFDGAPVSAPGDVPILPGTGVDYVLVNQGGIQGGAQGVFVYPVPSLLGPSMPPQTDNDETLDVVVGDFNDDGFPDLYFTNWFISLPGGNASFLNGPQLDRLFVNVPAPANPFAPRAFVDSSISIPDNPPYGDLTGFDVVGPWAGVDAEVIDFDQDGDMDIVIGLGSGGLPAGISGPPTPGLNRGLVFLANTPFAAAPFGFVFVAVGPGANDSAFAMDGDFLDLEPGDWQLDPAPGPVQRWSYFREDFGLGMVNFGFSWLGRQP